MILLKRLGLILAGLVLISLVAVVFLLPSSLESLGRRIDLVPSSARIALVIALDLMILAVIYWRIGVLGVSKRTGLALRVRGVAGDVSPESARERVQKAVLSVSNVSKVEADLKAVQGKADVLLKVWVDEGCDDLPAKQKEIARQLNQVVTKQIGARFAGNPRVYMYVEGDLSQMQPSFAEGQGGNVVRNAVGNDHEGESVTKPETVNQPIQSES